MKLPSRVATAVTPAFDQALAVQLREHAPIPALTERLHRLAAERAGR